MSLEYKNFIKVLNNHKTIFRKVGTEFNRCVKVTVYKKLTDSQINVVRQEIMEDFSVLCNIRTTKIPRELNKYNLCLYDTEFAYGDQYYYGKIPRNISKKSLIEIMIKGLHKFAKVHLNLGFSKREVIGYLERILESWFEHDSNIKNKFDYLIIEKDVENGYLEHIVECVKNLLRRKKLNKSK